MEDNKLLKTEKSVKSRAEIRQRRLKRRKKQKQKKQKKSQPSDKKEKDIWLQKHNENQKLEKQTTACENLDFCEKFKNQMAEAHRIWQNCYDNATNLMYTQQINYWRERATLLERENEELRARLGVQNGQRSEKKKVRECTNHTPKWSRFKGTSRVYGTSRERKMENVSEGFMQFMEIAQRHREEIRIKTEEDVQLPDIKIEK